MPSIIKSVSLAIVAGCLSGQIGWEVSAHAQTNKATGSVKGYQPAPKTAGKSTLQPTAQKGAPRDAESPPRISTAPPRAGRTQLDDERQELPQGKAMFIPKVSPQMEKILVEWEQKSARIQRLEGKFTRITYNHVFETEAYTEGKFCFAFPDKGSLQQVGSKVTEGSAGNRYTRKSGEPLRWVCDGERILRIDDKAKQYEEVTIPPEHRGKNIRKSPLPFLFGMKADEAKLRYSFELNEAKTNEQQIQVKVTPLTQEDLANYRMAEVLLDRKTCVPIAVKLHDDKGGKEDVYVFSKKDLTINDRNWTQWLGGDPLKPSLTNYKKVLTPVDNAEGDKGIQVAPRPTDRRTTSVPAAKKTLSINSVPQKTAQLPDDDGPPSRSSIKAKARP